MSQDFRRLNDKEISELIDNEELLEQKAIKDKPVSAILLTQEMVDEIKSKGGYKTIIRNPETGELVEETTNNKLKEGDYIVTNSIGEDEYENSYIVERNKFEKLYSPSGEPQIFTPNPEERSVFRTPEDVIFKAPWGEDIKLYSGGYIVREYIEGEPRYYGINKEEFESTYSIPIEENLIQKIKDRIIQNRTPEPDSHSPNGP